MPTRAHDTDAGFDLYARKSDFIAPHGWTTFDTGVHVQLPKSTCGLIVSKSGLNVKHGIQSTGLIDEGYTGPIIVKLYNFSDTMYNVEKGDKISQLVVIPIQKEELELTDHLEDTDRNSDGFGSTGK